MRHVIVLGMRHVMEVLIPGFKKPILLQRNASLELKGWQYTLERTSLLPARPTSNADTMKSKL